MEQFGYRNELYKLFRLKQNVNILESFTEQGVSALMIRRWGGTKALLEDRPCAFDEFGELVDLTGTGLDSEYDAEVLLEPDGQIKMFL